MDQSDRPASRESVEHGTRQSGWLVVAAVAVGGGALIGLVVWMLFMGSGMSPSSPAPAPLRMTPERVLASLEEDLYGQDEPRRSSAARSLTERGARGFGILCEAMQSGDSEMRRPVARALSEAGEEAVEPVSKLLKDEDPILAADAAWVLGQIGSPTAVEPLAEAMHFHLQRYDPEAETVSADFGEHLTQFTLHGPWNPTEIPVAAAVMALARIGDPSAREVLSGTLNVVMPATAREAAQALVVTSKDDASALRQTVTRLLRHPSADVRFGALRGVREVEDRGAVQEVLDRLHDPDHGVRRLAVETLGEIGDATPVGPLLAMLDGQHGFEAIRSLGQIGDERAVEPIIAAAQAERGGQQSVAAEALGRIGDARAVPALLAMLDGADEWTAKEIAVALGRIGDRRARAALLGLLDHEDWHVVVVAAEALGRIGGEGAVEDLLPLLDHEHFMIKDAAVKGLAETGDERALPVLVECLALSAGRSTRAIAKEGLVSAGPGAIPVLVQALSDEDDFTAREAGNVLLQMGEPGMAALEEAAEEGNEAARYALMSAGSGS